ncbi:MAG: phospholipase A [Gammaproteobacteria bacterium]
MVNCNYLLKTAFQLSVILYLLNPLICVADQGITSENAQANSKISMSPNPVQARASSEKKIDPNSFAIAFYRPTYVLPYYYTFSPDNAVYSGNTPGNEHLKSDEIKYQLSFKVPLWKNILGYRSTLYAAYSQLSYWQAYNHRAFFRETDYQPEIFLANELNLHILKKWRLNFLNFGAMHQSNGQGGTLERSWNRAYIGAVASNDNWVISLRPWYIIHDSTYERQNPNMDKFMGYGDIVVIFKHNNQVFSIETHNLIETFGKRSGTTASWSFPLTAYLKGYIQAFSGYGQSLIEYDHRTNALGVGIALSNWV